MSVSDRWNIDALSYLMDEDVTRIESAAQSAGIEYETVMGVARQVRAKGVGSLTAMQTRVFENAIRPLIDRVPCEGPVGIVSDDDESSCAHGGVIDDESLVLAYMEDDFVCQNCRYERSQMA